MDDASRYDASTIRKVCVASLVAGRPDRYTPNGTVDEVLTFFDGYEMGCMDGRDGRVRDDSPRLVRNRFLSQIPKADSPAPDIEDPGPRQDRILAHFGSEAAALEALRQIAREFDPPQ